MSTPTDHRPFAYTYTTSWRSIHRLANLPADNPEHDLHGHRYDIEVTFAGYELVGTGWVPGEFDADKIFEPWIQEHLEGKTLSDSFDFASTPSLIVAYLWDVFSYRARDHTITRLVLTVDGRHRHEYTPEPA